MKRGRYKLEKCAVSFNNIDELLLFTKLLKDNIKSEVNAYTYRSVVDAKSFVSMITIFHNPCILVKLLSNDEKDRKEFVKICDPYAIPYQQWRYVE